MTRVLKTYNIPFVTTTFQKFNMSAVPAFIKASCDMVLSENGGSVGAGAVININYRGLINNVITFAILTLCIALSFGSDFEKKQPFEMQPATGFQKAKEIQANALFVAAFRGLDKVTTFILKKDLTPIDAGSIAAGSSGQTQLYRALRSGQGSVARLLIEKGASLYWSSTTALHEAARANLHDVPLASQN
ncbi:hypothetical protein BKA56DRAFT_738838 [Ilyonectria sp. MPI-CAGE-AT-0026]|nr:hypothetical protein BKA56DRAFT_738838 [Ilyonectria sp. MPI-CAGE-AT-0026]